MHRKLAFITLITLSLGVVFVGCAKIQLKRVEPKKIPEVIISGKKYIVENQPGNIGEVSIVDQQDAHKTKSVRIYRLRYNPLKERDVQWKFITMMVKVHDKIYIQREDGISYIYNPVTNKVTWIK